MSTEEMGAAAPYATINMSNVGGVWHLEARSEAGNPDEAAQCVRLVYELFTSKFESWVRTEPEVNSDRDFDTQIWRHRGYVRFSFVERAGPVHAPEPHVFVPFSAA